MLHAAVQQWHTMEATQQDNQRIRDETEEWLRKYEALKKFAIANKISIPPEIDSL